MFVLALDHAPCRNRHVGSVGSVDEPGSSGTLDDCELHRTSPFVLILLFCRVESNVAEVARPL